MSEDRRIEKILVANRGEIALRVLRTVRRLGLAGVAVYSDADEDALHVRAADEALRIGPAPAAESYLDIGRILDAAHRSGADAIHPGYGFLSENAQLAERCEQAGICFIGPPADAIRRMGSKIEAKRLMADSGVPVIPGSSGGDLDDAALAKAAAEIGFPVLIKASAGGGGRGMRIVRAESELADAIVSARREAAAGFADDTLLAERWVESPRHIEIQILADQHGAVVHCFERECSIQRRFQKLIEEAPSPAVDAPLRERLGSAAVAAARAAGFVGAGTVEFILESKGPSASFYFLEMNTRLQVEHPVTEAITGLDLVELQIEIARGRPLPFEQGDLEISGHAVETRLYAEDPQREFLPSTGTIELWETAPLPGVRYDSGVTVGSEIGIHYDPLLAKVIAHGAARDQALDRASRALQLLGVGGVRTNRDFLRRVLDHPAFRSGEIDTGFIVTHMPAASRASERDESRERVHCIAAALQAHERRRARPSPLPGSIPSGWRNNRWRAQDVSYESDDVVIEVRYVAEPGGSFSLELAGETLRAQLRAGDADGIELEIDGLRRGYRIARAGDRIWVHSLLGTSELRELPRFPPPLRDEIAGGCAAPMPGIVREVRVRVGDRVERGTVLIVIEAMKMEHEIVASFAATIKEIRADIGQTVDPDEVLIVLEESS